MPQGISRRAFAKAVGMSESGVRKAEKYARIVLFSDGSVNLEASKKRLAENTDPARQRVRTKPEVRSAQVRTPAEAAPPIENEEQALGAVELVRRVLEQGGHDGPASPVSYQTARVAESILKSRERELRLQRQRGELVSIADVRAHVFKAFVGYRQAMQRIPVRHAGSIAAALGVDAGKLERLLDAAIRSELEALSAPVVRA